jgi:hypothetical protein
MKPILKIISMLFLLIIYSCSKSTEESTGTEKTVAVFAEGGLNEPTEMCIDSEGNFFVTNYENNQIKKITPTGQISVFAGSTQSGFQNGNGTAARFYKPTGICIDAQDNLYVVDTFNHVIRKITPTGTVSTFCGNGDLGFVNGSATDTRFTYPEGIVIDSNGNFFVADSGNEVIRKITSNGTSSTFAGSTPGYLDGNGSNAKFNYPEGLMIDQNNTIYVCETHRIRKITPNGDVTTIAGEGTPSFADGTTLQAKFHNPRQTCFDDQGNLLVADYTNNRIRKISNGNVTTYIGEDEDDKIGSLQQTRFYRPSDLLFYNNKLYILDSRNNKIKVVQ